MSENGDVGKNGDVGELRQAYIEREVAITRATVARSRLRDKPLVDEPGRIARAAAYAAWRFDAVLTGEVHVL